MMNEDLAEAPSEEIFCLLDMAIRKKIFLGHLHFLFFFFVGFFLHIINNLLMIRLKKERETKEKS